jgi:plasmid stabilization system protein ParE
VSQRRAGVGVLADVPAHGRQPPGRRGHRRRGRVRAGAWYYQLLDDIDHIDVVALPQLDQVGWQKRFYRSLFTRLAAL